MNLFHELKRRNVLRVGAAYIVTAWLIIQVVETILPAFGFGDSIVRYVTIAAAIGLLPVLILSWAFELTPEGLKKDSEIERAESIAPQTGKKLDRVIMVVLALAVSYFGFDKFVLAPARDAAEAEQLAARIDAARKEGRTEALIESFGDKSIAVLPFVNMSPDPEQAYFSDGISEELLNLLAKIPELRVISRSSAFAFKGKDINIVDVGEQLNVGHVLEGSVRQSGERIRVTAQLIEARTDSHLWSETYDREMGDIFGIQDDIAAMVVDQLKLELLGEQPQSEPADPEAYRLFLQARHVAHRGTPEGLEEAIDLYQRALEIDPEYVPAWDALAVAYDNQVAMGLRPMKEGADLARAATERALALDPDYAQAHAELGWIATSYDSDLAAAARHYERALRLDPDNIYVISGAAVLLKALGRVSEALALEQYVAARDPLNPAIHHNAGVSYFHTGQWGRAIQSWRTVLRLSPGHVGGHYFIALMLIEKGEPEAALAEAEKEAFEVFSLAGRTTALKALGRIEEYEASRRRLVDNWSEQFPAIIGRVLAENGEVEPALDLLESALEAGLGGRIDPVDRAFDSLRGQPRWETILERLGKAPEQLEAIEFEARLPTPDLDRIAPSVDA
jgi:TolB-like protein/Tfp pilus assembly protein PilF